MEIKLNQKDKNSFLNLLKVKQTNIALGEMLTDLTLFRNPRCQKFIKEELDKNRPLLEIAIDILGIDYNEPENRKIINEYLNQHFLLMKFSLINKLPD